MTTLGRLGRTGRAALARALVAGPGGALLGVCVTALVWYVDELPPPLPVFVLPPLTLALLLALPAAASAWVEAWRPGRPVLGPLVVLLASAATAAALVVEGVWLHGVSRAGGDPQGGFEALGRALDLASTPGAAQAPGFALGLALASGVPPAAVVRRRLLRESSGDALGRGLRDTLLVALAVVVLPIPLLVLALQANAAKGPAAVGLGLYLGAMPLALYGPILAPAWSVLLALGDRVQARLEVHVAGEPE